MNKVYVIGNGQLGCMLRQAGEPLGISVLLIELNSNPETISFQNSIITTEIEQWPNTSLARKLKNHDNFINNKSFPIVIDRLTQRKFCNKLKLNTVPWKPLKSKNEWSTIFNEFGELVFVKKRIGGYNGCGQWQLFPNTINQLPDNCYNTCIVDQAVDFIDEISLIGARAYDGTMVFYPLTYNLHKEGILKVSVFFPNINSQYQTQAEMMLSTIMNKLNYVGVMTMECFVTLHGLLINELAPRVHNSGHWTQNGASISQFELHLRAITCLPLPKPLIIAPSVMINLIGIKLNYDWIKFSTVHLHWYNKKVLPRRKVGHINLIDTDVKRLSSTLDALVSILPKEYNEEINWVKLKLLNK